MENLILIKYDRQDLENLEEEVVYLVLFERSRASIIFPGPKYIKSGTLDETIEYYSEMITRFDKQEISMRYKGLSARNQEHLFEIDPSQIIRNKKLNELLGGED